MLNYLTYTHPTSNIKHPTLIYIGLKKLILHHKNYKIKVEIIIRFFHKIWREFLFISLYIFILNVYIGKQETTINADGIGYYDYLPSLFIHKDMNRHHVPFDTK